MAKKLRKSIINAIFLAELLWLSMRALLNEPFMQSQMEKAYEAQDWDATVACSGLLLRLNPKKAGAHLSRGIAYLHKGQYDDALEDFDQAIALNPNHSATYVQLGYVYHLKNDLKKSLTDYDRALQLDGKNPQAFRCRGDALASSGQLEKAVGDYTCALSLSKDAQFLEKRGACFAKLGKFELALKDVNEALELRPKSAYAYVLRGAVYAHQGRHEKAVADFIECNKIDPLIPEAYLNRSGILWSNHKRDEALEVLNSAVKRGVKSPEIIRLQAVWHRAIRETDKVFSDLLAKIEADPGDLVARKRLEELFLEISESEMAVCRLKEILRVLPENTEYLNRLGWLLATCSKDSVRNGKAAVEYARKACELTSFGTYEYLETLAAAHAETGDFPEAIKTQKAALALLEDFPPDDLDQELRKGLESRLRLYQGKRPYRAEK